MNINNYAYLGLLDCWLMKLAYDDLKNRRNY